MRGMRFSVCRDRLQPLFTYSWLSEVDPSPSWAPDGRRVVLAGGNGVYIGSGINFELTTELDEVYESAPAWSPGWEHYATRLVIVARDGRPGSDPSVVATGA